MTRETPNHAPCFAGTASLESQPSMSKSARYIIIGRPNGAGKTTFFAREFLSKEGGVVHFVNLDLITSGLSPLRLELATLAVARFFLLQLD